MKHYIRILTALLCFCLLLPLLVGFTACSSEPPAENRVTSVTLTGESIRIEAVLTKGFLEGYDQKKIYLFELPSVYSGDADLSELDPVAEAKPRGSLSFTLPLYDGARTRLHSSFLVASYDPSTNSYVPLSPPAALSNPEALASAASGVPVGEVSIKGLVSDSPADAIRLGVTHTVVDVPMERIILSGWQNDATSYVYNGVTRYLDSAALAALDETVNVYTAAGVEVYLRFILGDPTGYDVPQGLYFPSATASGASDYAVNMTTPFSTLILEGFFDFIADRYASPAEGRRAVNAFILGNGVNNGVATNNAAGLNHAAYITNYEKLTRVAYAALVSHNAEGRVYIAPDGRRTVTDGQGWDTASFLSAFSEEVGLRGDYGWHVACELHADTPAVWEDDPAADSAYFTIRNLGVLTGLLDAYRVNSQPRRLLISGFSIPAVPRGTAPSADNNARQAASYAYAYLTCVQNGRVEALIYNVHIDPATTAEDTHLCGLWTAEQTGEGESTILRPASTRPIYDVFGRIDTTEASSLSVALTEIMGASYTKLESALAGKASAVTFVKGNGSLLPYSADHKKASPLYLFDSGSFNGFSDGGSLTYMELVNAETLGINALHARFDRENAAQPMGLTVTLPASHLIGGKELILDLYGGPLDISVSRIKTTVTLRLTRASKGNIADGEGEIRYETSVTDVKSGSWQTASFDITAFTALLDASDEVTMTLIMDYPADTAPKEHSAHHIGIAGIYVSGITAATGVSSKVVVAVVITLILLVAVVTVLLFLRHRRKN